MKSTSKFKILSHCNARASCQRISHLWWQTLAKIKLILEPTKAHKTSNKVAWYRPRMIRISVWISWRLWMIQSSKKWSNPRAILLRNTSRRLLCKRWSNIYLLKHQDFHSGKRPQFLINKAKLRRRQLYKRRGAKLSHSNFTRLVDVWTLFKELVLHKRWKEYIDKEIVIC